MPVPGSLDPLTSTTEELCGCLGRGSTGPSSRRAGRGPGHKTREAAPAGEPGASHKGRLGGRLRQQWQSRRAVGDGKLCRAGQELRRNVRAVHEQHSQLFRALAQFSSSGNAVSDSSAAPARAYPPPAPLTASPYKGRTRVRPLGGAGRGAGAGPGARGRGAWGGDGVRWFRRCGLWPRWPAAAFYSKRGAVRSLFPGAPCLPLHQSRPLDPILPPRKGEHADLPAMSTWPLSCCGPASGFYGPLTARNAGCAVNFMLIY